MSTRIVFLEIPRAPIERAVCFAVRRQVEDGHRVVVRAADTAQASRIDELLWTFEPNSFIPHRRVGDGPVQPDLPEPVVIATHDMDWPDATGVVLAAPAPPEWCERFEVVVDFAVKFDAEALQASRARFRAWRDRGLEPEYFDRGGRR